MSSARNGQLITRSNMSSYNYDQVLCFEYCKLHHYRRMSKMTAKWFSKQKTFIKWNIYWEIWKWLHFLHSTWQFQILTVNCMFYVYVVHWGYCFLCTGILRLDCVWRNQMYTYCSGFPVHKLSCNRLSAAKKNSIYMYWFGKKLIQTWIFINICGW